MEREPGAVHLGAQGEVQHGLSEEPVPLGLVDDHRPPLAQELGVGQSAAVKDPCGVNAAGGPATRGPAPDQARWVWFVFVRGRVLHSETASFTVMFTWTAPPHG